MSSYRKNVAAIIINNDGKILVCRRSDEFKNWQLPQGGIDEGESAEVAVLRELEEEIGTKEFEILGKLAKSIKYDWPEKLHSRGFVGQDQQYFLLKITDKTKIRLPSVEFDAMKWVTKEQFTNGTNAFKAEAYKKAIDQFTILFPGLIHD